MPRIKTMLAEGKVVRGLRLRTVDQPEIDRDPRRARGVRRALDRSGTRRIDHEGHPSLATMAARSYGMDHFVRLPATDYAAVMRPLEAGAGGVMISMVRSAEEVEAGRALDEILAARRARAQWRQPRWPIRPRPPGGIRGEGERRDVSSASRSRPPARSRRPPRSPPCRMSTCCSSGPSDLSQVLGVTGDFLRTRAAWRRSSRSLAPARRPGSPGASSSRGPDYAVKMRDLGCRLFVIAADLHVVHSGIRDIKSRYSSFFPRSLKGKSVLVSERCERLTR